MKYTFLLVFLFAAVAAFGQNSPVPKDSAAVQTQPKLMPSVLNAEPLFYLGDKEIVRDDLQKINPEDIESISVLKDKDAIAIYGERGKVGVIVITMKKQAQTKVVGKP